MWLVCEMRVRWSGTRWQPGAALGSATALLPRSHCGSYSHCAKRHQVKGRPAISQVADWHTSGRHLPDFVPKCQRLTPVTHVPWSQPRPEPRRASRPRWSPGSGTPRRRANYSSAPTRTDRNRVRPGRPDPAGRRTHSLDQGRPFTDVGVTIVTRWTRDTTLSN